MRTVGIYAGNFQPPHRGHYEAYKKLRQIAGADTYVVTTDYDPTVEAALHFGDKEQILARHGIPSSHIRQVKNLLNPQEVLQNYDPETTIVIYGVNKPEADRLINKSSYYKGIDFAGSQLKPFKHQSYVFIVDDSKVGDRVFSSKNIRECLGSHRFTDEQKKKWFKHFFGWFDLGLFELLKNKYTNAHQSDSSQAGPIKEELAKEIRKILGELSYDNSSGTDNSNDGMPTVDNMPQNNSDARKQALQQKQDLVKQKQQSERDLKSMTTDLKWKNSSVLSLRKDQIPNKRREIDNINQQITNATVNPPTSGT